MITSFCNSGLSNVRILKISLLLAFVFVGGFRLKAQNQKNQALNSDSTQLQVLETRRGDQFLGSVLSIKDGQVTFAFRETDTLRFKEVDIKRISTLETFRKGSDFRTTFLSVTPTAYNLPKGNWEYRNVDLLWNSLHYAASDHFSIRGGFMVPVLFTLSMKLTFEVSEKLSLGIFNQHYFAFGDISNPASTFALLGTYGRPNGFFNVAIGFIGEWGYMEEAIPYVSIGGSRRFTDRIGGHVVINSGMADGEPLVFPTGAINYYGKNNRLSFGFSIETTDDFLELFAIPIVSFSQRF